MNQKLTLILLLCAFLIIESCKTNKTQTASVTMIGKNDSTVILIDSIFVPLQIVHLIGKQTISDILLCDSIKSYLINSFEITNNSDSMNSYIVGHKVKKESKKLSIEQIAKLKTWITDTNSYSFDKSNTCLFKPKIGFQFFHPKAKTIVLFSLDCDKWAFINDSTKVYTDFNPDKLKITPLVNELFDTIVQSKNNKK